MKGDLSPRPECTHAGIDSVRAKRGLGEGGLPKSVQIIFYTTKNHKNKAKDAQLSAFEDLIKPTSDFGVQNVLLQSLRNMNRGAALGGEVTYALFTAQYDVPYTAYAYSETIQNTVSGNGMYV